MLDRGLGWEYSGQHQLRRVCRVFRPPDVSYLSKKENVMSKYDNASLSDLTRQLTRIKGKEHALKLDKLEVETELLIRFGKLSNEGTAHLYTENGKEDITATSKLNYSLDADAFATRNKKLLPINVAPITTKISLDMTAYRLLEKINPEAFEAMQKFVTTKPAKTSVSFKDVKKK